MSVASDITALTTKLTTIFDQIKTSLTGKGVSGLPTDYSEVPAKIDSIVTGSGIDTSDATAAAGDIRSGKTAYVDGSKITGSLSFTERSSSDLTASGATVSVPAGLYSSNASKSVSSVSRATPSISYNSTTRVVTASVTQSAGYVTAGTSSATYTVPASNAFSINGTDISQYYGTVQQKKLTVTVTNDVLDGDVCGVMVFVHGKLTTLHTSIIDSMMIIPSGNNYQIYLHSYGDSSTYNKNYGLSVTKGASTTEIEIDVDGMYLGSNNAKFDTSGTDLIYYILPLVN